MEELQEHKYALEEKWIKNQISKDTYDRWSSNYSSTETQLKMAIDRFSTNHADAFDKLKTNLHMLAEYEMGLLGCRYVAKKRVYKYGVR